MDEENDTIDDIHNSGFDVLLNRVEKKRQKSNNEVTTNYGIVTSAYTNFVTSLKIDELPINATLTLSPALDSFGNTIYTATSVVSYKKQNRKVVPVIIGFITTGTIPNEKRSLLPYYDGQPDPASGNNMNFNVIAAVQGGLIGATITISAISNVVPSYDFTLYVLTNR